MPVKHTLRYGYELKCAVLRPQLRFLSKNVKLLFHPTLPDFLPRLLPFVLVRATCRWEISMEHWWNDTDKGKLKCSEKNLSLCQSVHQKSRRDSPGIFFFHSLVLSLYFIRTCFWVSIVLQFGFLLYSTIHTTQTSMPPAEFEPSIPADELPQTYALDPTATVIGCEPRPSPWRADN